METPEIPEKTARRFADIAEELAGRGVSVTKMFGMPSLKAGGKLFAGSTVTRSRSSSVELYTRRLWPSRVPSCSIRPAWVGR
ncbi:MAG: hypothetical protein ACRDH7_16300 [Actinomycetota bacterium]